MEALDSVKPTDSRRQEQTFQQTASQLRLKFSLVRPSPVLEEVEAAFFVLPLAQCFAALEPLQALSVDLSAVPHPAPKQGEFVVTVAHFGDRYARSDCRYRCLGR